MVFYTYSKEDDMIYPLKIVCHNYSCVFKTALYEWWTHDILTRSGFNKLQEVAHNTKSMLIRRVN